jgi:thiol-disulfide isomerase/thioredoxin
LHDPVPVLNDVDHTARGVGAMSLRWLFAGVALLALMGGGAMYLGSHPGRPAAATDVSPAAIYAASFRDAQGASRSLAQYHDRLLVVNFWATWCPPCREEMPAFARVQSRWAARNVQFVGIAKDDPGKVERYGKALGITYPLWTGGDDVGELSKRLGNRLDVLPHTVILAPGGKVLEQKVGPYTEAELNSRLEALVAK